MSTALKALIIASERAARIARSCLENDQSLLVTEKTEEEANKRFNKDYKTIADVLAQIFAKYEISLYCPNIQLVRGEETTEINGTQIDMSEILENTQEALVPLVGVRLAACLAKAAHSPIDIPVINEIPNIESPWEECEELGIWIDPIVNGTAEFISGVTGEAKPGHGLLCVTVLIGAYIQSSGKPVMGVINQPFYNNCAGRILWGFSYMDGKYYSPELKNLIPSPKIVLMSDSERKYIKDKLTNAGWTVQTHPGAGNKLMKLVLGEASAYILSKGTTYRWDTCAPHAILQAIGGDIVTFNSHQAILYNITEQGIPSEACNSGGIIAFSDSGVYGELKLLLSEFHT